MLDIEALRTFLAIHQFGGFSQAADVLGRTQPAISRRMAQLEEGLGAPLFERLPGGVRLSLAGQALLPHAERAVAVFEVCRRAMASIAKGEAGAVTLAVVGTLAGAGIAGVLRQVNAEFPGVALSIRSARSAEVSALVRLGDVALGLRYFRDRSEDIDCVHLFDEPRRIVCAPDHPLAGVRLKQLALLADETWLAFPNTLPPRAAEPDAIFAQLLIEGVSEPTISPIDSLTAQKRMAEAGLGIAVLPESAIVDELKTGTLAVIDVEGVRPVGPVCLVTRRGGYLSPAAERLAGLLREGGRR